MGSTEDYISICDAQKRKRLGQFFTPPEVALFMASWVKDCKNILDPAVGNNIFQCSLNQLNPKATYSFTGYEVDMDIAEFFHLDVETVKIQDYLLSGWGCKYDGIICNPPYNKFQSVKNREKVYETFEKETGQKYSRYTNQYILFLLKSLQELSDDGKLVYIIPSEFLNSNYGTFVKKILVNQKLIRAIINFEKPVFADALTTCCIVFIDRSEKDCIEFVSLSDYQEISTLRIDAQFFSKNSMIMNYSRINPEEKWLNYLKNTKEISYFNTKKFGTFCDIHRGIATGDNDYYLFNKEKVDKFSLSMDDMLPCICSSRDVDSVLFKQDDLERIIEQNRNIFVLNVRNPHSEAVEHYLEIGINNGVDKKYLPAHRRIWYLPEKQKPADLWITAASRDSIKVVKNCVAVNNLTSFHSVFIKDKYHRYQDIIFCYLLTPIAQKIISNNKKELGNGLSKFQPRDYLESEVYNFDLLKEADIDYLNSLFSQFERGDIELSVLIELTDNLFTDLLLRQ